MCLRPGLKPDKTPRTTNPHATARIADRVPLRTIAASERRQAIHPSHLPNSASMRVIATAQKRATVSYTHLRIRQAEGRGSDDPEYFRALPYRDLTGKNSEQWAIRARTWKHFERLILAEIERQTARPLDVLDVGAGNGWMLSLIHI